MVAVPGVRSDAGHGSLVRLSNVLTKRRCTRGWCKGLGAKNMAPVDFVKAEHHMAAKAVWICQSTGHVKGCSS